MMRRAVNTVRSALHTPQGISDIAWIRFIYALTISDDTGPTKGKPRTTNSISYSGGLGSYAIQPRRLLEIEFLKEVFVSRGKAIANIKDQRVTAFLLNQRLQDDALALLLKRYMADCTPLPAGMTRSGALALYHRLGPEALVKWKKHQEGSTKELFQRANGLF